jgi:nucleoside triphosphate pyrophosphatase
MCNDTFDTTLILASRSPRRRELLAAAGYQFEVRPAAESAEDGSPGDQDAATLVARFACQKASDVGRSVRRGLILGCDTVAECDGAILGKPADAEHARRMLCKLRGREHRVFSGLCLWSKPRLEPITEVDVTVLRMDPLRDEEIDEYVAGGAWRGKAGGFGYQDHAGWVHIVRGSESNVVGLPMELLARMLARIRRTSMR